MSELDRYLG